MTSDSFTGVGTTVAECQGAGSASGTLAGQVPNLKSGFAAYMESAVNVFLFSRDFVATANFPGEPGEWKMRLMLTSSMGGDQYGASMFIGQWDATGQRWEGSTTGTAVVTLADYTSVEATGLMCSGRTIGQAEGLFNANDYVIVTFAVPLLTASFPSDT